MNSYRKTVFFVALAQKKGTKEMWAYARKKVTMKKKTVCRTVFLRNRPRKKDTKEMWAYARKKVTMIKTVRRNLPCAYERP